MDGRSWTNIYGTTLGSGMKKTDKTLFLVLRFLKATPFVVLVLYGVLVYGLACFVVFSYLVR